LPAPTTYHSIAPYQPTQTCPAQFSKPQTPTSASKFSTHPAPPPAGYYLVPEFCTASTKKPPLSSCCSSNTSATTSPNQFRNHHCLLIHSGIGFCSSRPDLKNFEISLQRQKSRDDQFEPTLLQVYEHTSVSRPNVRSRDRALLQQ